MVHDHKIVDDDYRFIVDPVTRQITNEESGSISLMQYDHNCERFTFEIPRYIEGHDLFECTSVQVHYTNTASGSMRRSNFGVYPILDLEISADDDETLICTWLISQNATQLVGMLDFTLRFACVESGKIQYIWSTIPYEGVNIVKTIYNGDDVIQAYPETLEELEQNLRDRLIMSIEQTSHGVGSDAANEITVTFGDGTKQTFHTYNGGQGTCVCDDEGVLTVDGRRLHIFIGTKAEYEALSAAQKENLFAITTDDTTTMDIFNSLASSDKKIISLENLIVSLMARITILETSLAASGKTIATIESSLAALETRMKSVENKVGNSSSNATAINNLSAQIGKLSTKVNELITRVTALEGGTGGDTIETPTSSVTIQNDSVTQLNISYVNVEGISGTMAIEAGTSSVLEVRTNSVLYIATDKQVVIGTNSYGYSIANDGRYCFTIYDDGSITIDNNVKSVAIQNDSAASIRVFYTNIDENDVTVDILEANSHTIEAVTNSMVCIAVNGADDFLVPKIIAVSTDSYECSITDAGLYSFTVDEDGAIVVLDKDATEFQIEDETFNSVIGVTWYEWAASQDNTSGFICESPDSAVRLVGLYRIVEYNGAAVFGRDRIIQGEIYNVASAKPSLSVTYVDGKAQLTWKAVTSGVTYTVCVGSLKGDGASYVTSNANYIITSDKCDPDDECWIEVYAGGEYVGYSNTITLKKLTITPSLTYRGSDETRAVVSSGSTDSSVVCHWALDEEGVIVERGTANIDEILVGPLDGPGGVSAFNRRDGYIDSDTVSLTLAG